MNDFPETEHQKPVMVKVSRLAITAISLALCGLFFTILLIISAFSLLIFRFGLLFYYLMQISLISAIVLGFISIIIVDKSGGRKTGHGFALGAIIIPVCTFLVLGILLPALAKARVSYRLICGSNLSAIGKAMLIYADDYNGELPRAGGSSTIWGTSVNWNASSRQDAYSLKSDGTGGAATISSSLYLLVKYSEVPPEKFICAEDRKVNKFNPAKYNKGAKDITQLWDFGPQSWKHNSYSYHMLYGPYFLTTKSDPGLPLAADRNPFLPSLGWQVKDFKEFAPVGDRSIIRAGNTPCHANEGQNVLFLDSHVDFTTVSFCGINEDNIYTSWSGDDIRKGTPPKLGSQPADKMDSLLVNDPPVQKP